MTAFCLPPFQSYRLLFSELKGVRAEQLTAIKWHRNVHIYIVLIWLKLDIVHQQCPYSSCPFFFSLFLFLVSCLFFCLLFFIVGCDMFGILRVKRKKRDDCSLNCVCNIHSTWQSSGYMTVTTTLISGAYVSKHLFPLFKQNGKKKKIKKKTAFKG